MWLQLILGAEELTSTGGIDNAMKLADAIGINFNLQDVWKHVLGTMSWGWC